MKSMEILIKPFFFFLNSCIQIQKTEFFIMTSTKLFFLLIVLTCKSYEYKSRTLNEICDRSVT